MKTGAVQVQMLSDGDRTVVEAAYHSYAYPSVVGRGSASRGPEDKSNTDVGEALAVARALRRIAARLERQAAGDMKHSLDIRAHKAELKDNPQPRPLQPRRRRR